MKKALIVLYAYKPFDNANTNVVLPLIYELSKYYQVDIVTLNADNSADDISSEKNITIYRYKKHRRVKEILLQMYYSDPKKNRNGIKGLLVPLGNLVSRFLFSIGYLRHNEYQLLKQLICINQYEFIFSTCESFISCLNVLRLKEKNLFSCPWITYFMDPYSRYIENVDSKKYRDQEHKIYRYSDLVLVTEEIYEQNSQDDFSIYLTKTKAVKFGNFFIKPQAKSGIDTNYQDGCIQCVYAGSLINKRIRDPGYFFNIIKHLNDRYIFHLVLYRLPKERIEKYKSELSGYNNVVWYDSLSKEETQAIVSRADILINLGNRVINQTPSKIFEYMATGKPIVNIHSLDNDTSKKYLREYPLCLNILEDQNKIIENSIIFDEFCILNKNNMVSPSDLEERFKQYDQGIVVKQTLDYIHEIV